MPQNVTMKEIYDIAAAFITDRNTKVEIEASDMAIVYEFTKYGLATYPYVMTIVCPRGASTLRKVTYKNTVTKQERVVTEGDKKCGEVILSRGAGFVSTDPIQPLAQAKTKANVGRAEDRTQSDLSKFIARLQSPRFFSLYDLAQARAMGRIKTTDNTTLMFNIIYRLKENQH